MTIKELEEKTGLARANIRYYEQQGLVHPARQENGYRDYTEEDLATLRKVKLLRHLGLGIDTIRAVQRGAQPLGEALAAREEELGGEAALLAREKAVCRELRGSGIAYDTLQPETYLAALEREETGDAVRPEQGDIIRPLKCPWRRFFARSLDWSIYSWLWSLLAARFLPLEGTAEAASSILGWCIALLLMLALEPLLLSRFGTTPGKWILGLRVSDVYGEKLTYDQALRRTWWVLLQGMGLNFYLVNFYFTYKSYERCMAGVPSVWEENTVSTLKDTKAWRGFVYVGIYAAVILIGLCTYQPELPNHGPLTKADFIENCNVIAEREGYARQLEYDGTWQKASWEYDPYYDWDQLPVTYELLYDDQGAVMGVRLHIETDAEANVEDFKWQFAISYEVLQSRMRGIGAILHQSDWKEIPFNESGAYQCGNVMIQCDVVSENMALHSNSVWNDVNRQRQHEAAAHTEVGEEIIYEKVDGYYACTVTLTLTE